MRQRLAFLFLIASMGAMLLGAFPASAAKLTSPAKIRQHIRQNLREINQKTETLALKYRQLSAANSIAQAQHQYQDQRVAQNAGTTGNDFEVYHAARTTTRMKNLEVETLKGEIRELKSGIQHLKKENKRLSAKI